MNRLFRTITTSQDQNSVVPLHKHQDIEHKILIEALELEMSIGILPEEKNNKQRALVDLEVFIEPKSNYEDDINETVSYAEIISKIEELAHSKHFNLVETLARDIADICLSFVSAYKVNVSVSKPDIIKNVKTVGFSMTVEK